MNINYKILHYSVIHLELLMGHTGQKLDLEKIPINMNYKAIKNSFHCFFSLTLLSSILEFVLGLTEPYQVCKAMYASNRL